MRKMVRPHNADVRAHLIAEFGDLQEHHGIYAPPPGVFFTVMEALQVEWRHGKKSRVIAKGEELAVRILRSHDHFAHGITCEHLRAFHTFYVVAGYGGEERSDGLCKGTCVDWRGVKKYVEGGMA